MIGRLLRSGGQRANSGLTVTDPITAWGRGWTARAEATRQGAHWSCVRLIADGVAKMPLRSWVEDASGVHEPVPLPSAIVDPGPRYPSTYDWLFVAVASMAMQGNAVGLPLGVDRSTGLPLSLDWVSTKRVQVLEALGKAPEFRVDGVPVDVVHVPLFPTADSIWSVSPEEHFRRTFDLGAAAEQFAADWYQNGAHPSSIVTYDGPPASDDDIARAKQKFEDAARDRHPVFMAKVNKIERLQSSPSESHAEEALAWVVAETARIHNVPVEMLGGQGANLTYSNREQRMVEFISLALDAYLTRLEAMFTRYLAPEGVRIGFDRDASLRSDRRSRVEADKLAIESHTTGINELRVKDGRQPVLGGDDPVVSAAGLRERVGAAYNLIRAGVDSSEAFATCGLPDMTITDEPTPAPTPDPGGAS